MSITKNENPQYDWDVKLDRTLQHPVKVVAANKNIEIRQYISDVIRKAVIMEKVIK